MPCGRERGPARVMVLMKSPYLSILTAFAVSVVQPLSAQQHLVPLDELHARLGAAARDRDRSAADIERVLAYPAAARALEKYHVTPQQVTTAVATLSDAELARFA